MQRVGHYRLLAKLGQGGMGVVWIAHDERLDRQVALKRIVEPSPGNEARQRFWREARAAARVTHPNVCQLYEIGEDQGELYITMELLEGRSLEDRLKDGPLAVEEVVDVGLGMLAAFEALHARGVIHRDVKPSNVFLSTHGVKLLDFGLARPCDPLGAHGPEAPAVTQPGMLVGTPQYMAPEQVYGHELDGRADLFSTGTVLFEATAGRPAFHGRTAVEVLYAVLHEQPPALSGGPAVAALDRVLRKSLAKRREERYPSAAAMAGDLRRVLGFDAAGSAPRARPVTRLIALPFRMLRPDPDTDFLAFSLPEAVSTSLTGLASVVVRSSAAGARFVAEALDLRRLASEAEVDLVLTGSILRGNGHIRVATQLLEAPSGTVVWSHSFQGSLKDVFALQDDLVHRIVESLSIPLSAGEQQRLVRDVPQSASAYEFYLRANQLDLYVGGNAEVARDLYERCLEQDPTYALAWARLGRVHRFIGKFKEHEEANLQKAEQALRRALDLSPDLPLAHNLYTYVETGTGRALAAIARLLGQLETTESDPALLAGLAQACRYCGLMEASLAAHDEARRLDPTVPTPLLATLFIMGDYERLLSERLGLGEFYLKSIALACLGRHDEALKTIEEAAGRQPYRAERMNEGLRAVLAGRLAEARAEWEAADWESTPDPEFRFMFARNLSYIGDTEGALANLERSVEGGYFALASSLPRDSWLDPLRGSSRFRDLVADAERRRREAAEAFRDAGGEALLGVRV